jgi:hypothetical protein
MLSSGIVYAHLWGSMLLQDTANCAVKSNGDGKASAEGSRPAEYLAAVAQPYLELPCGIIRGMFALDLGCLVWSAG